MNEIRLNQGAYWEDRYKSQGYMGGLSTPKMNDVSQILKLIPEFNSNDADKKKEIIEVGCGTGITSGLFPDENYYGIDISETAVKIASLCHPKKKFGACSLKDLPEDKVYDLLVSFAVLSCVPKDEINEVAEKIKKISKVAILMENPTVPFEMNMGHAYNFPHEYEKLFNVKYKIPFSPFNFYVVDNEKAE